MLAAIGDDRDVTALPRSSTKRKNVLKKTFQVIGKVKPFKKNKDKTMELMKSCASFDFEAEPEDCDGTDDFEQTEGDIEAMEMEEDDAELESVSRKLDNVKDSSDGGYDNCETEDGQVVLSENRTNPGRCTPSTPGSSPSSKDPIQPPSDLQRESPKIVRYSRSAKESSSQSPGVRKSAMSKSLRSSHRAGTVPEHSTTLPSARSSPLPTSMNVDSSKTLSSSQAALHGPPQKHPDVTIGDRDDSIAEPLKRCSEAFCDNIAMGGYFAKLQEKVNSEGHKTQSYKVQDDSVDPCKSLDDKRRRPFKPSKNIRKLLGIKETDAEVGDPKDPELANKDEAVNLMLQLNTLLVAHTVDSEERRLRPHTTRAARSFVFDEVDDEDLTQEFPEIPAAKKTSLSEIRRMMESPDVNPLGAPHTESKQHPSTRLRRESRSFVFDQDVPKQDEANISAEARLSHRHKRRSAGQIGGDSTAKAQSRPKHHAGRTHTSDKSRTSKSHHDTSHRRSSTGNQGMEARDYDKSPKSSLAIMNQSPTSVAELPTDDNGEEEQERTDSPRHHKEENPSPQSTQKDSVHDVPKKKPNSPLSSRRGPRSTYKHGKKEPDSEEIVPIKPASSHGTSRRRTSSRNSDTSTHGSIHVNDVKEKASRCLDQTESPMDLHRKRVQRRQGERRSNSDLGRQQGQSKRSSASANETIPPSRQKSFDVGIEKSNNVDIPVKSSESMMNEHPKLCPNGPKRERQNDRDKLAAPSSTNKLLLSNSTSSLHPIPYHEEGDPTSIHHHDKAKKPANDRSNCSQHDKEREKAKNPSLAKSLEQDRSSLSTTRNDCQYSVSTDDCSEMFVTVKGNRLYSKIRSDDSVGAPQLIIGANDLSKSDLLVKNV